MRKLALLGLVVLLGCSADFEINGGGGGPTAPIPTDAQGNTIYEDSQVVGVVTDREGAPAGGVEIDVVATDTGNGISRAFLTLVSFGLACLPSGDCGPSASTVGTATTGPDGAYDFVLPEGYLAGYETDTDWIVTARRGGAVSLFEFEANAAVQEAPALPLWDATPAVDDSGTLLRIDLDPAPQIEESARYERTVAAYDLEGLELWRILGETVDARVLEDVPVRILGSVEADRPITHGEGRTIYHQRISTPPVDFTGTLVPLSRGKPCTTAPAPTPGCTATDGDLLTVPNGESPDATTIDLGTAQDVGLIVVRGCQRCTVETSLDGTTWEALPARLLVETSGLSAGTDVVSARYVRVAEAVDPGESAEPIREISVWPPTAATPDDDAQAGLLEPDGDDDGGGAGRLAAALAALAIGGLAYGLLRVWRQLRGPTNMPA